MGWDAGYVPFNRNEREALKAHLMNEYTFKCADGSHWVAESISLKSGIAHIIARRTPAGVDPSILTKEEIAQFNPALFTVLIRWEGTDLATKGIGCDPGNSVIPKKFVKVLYTSIQNGNPELSDWEAAWIIEEWEKASAPSKSVTTVAIPGEEFGYAEGSTVLVKKMRTGRGATGRSVFSWIVIKHDTSGHIMGYRVSSRVVNRWKNDESMPNRLVALGINE